MPRFSVNYKTLPVQPTPAFPHRNSTHRPYLPVILSHNGREFHCYAIVDSGADDCLFPALFAGQIGLDLRSGRPYTFSGAGSRRQTAYFFEIGLEIPGVLQAPCTVGFTDALDLSSIGLLGQNGFFDRVDISFQLRQRIFIIET